MQRNIIIFQFGNLSLKLAMKLVIIPGWWNIFDNIQAILWFTACWNEAVNCLVALLTIWALEFKILLHKLCHYLHVGIWMLGRFRHWSYYAINWCWTKKSLQVHMKIWCDSWIFLTGFQSWNFHLRKHVWVGCLGGRAGMMKGDLTRCTRWHMIWTQMI